MATLTAVIISLTGGISALAGTAVWLAFITVRRLRGIRTDVTLRDLRHVWGISAAVGIPLLFPWMPDFIVASGEALLPYLYLAAIGLLAASASIAIGTVLCLLATWILHLAGLPAGSKLDPLNERWQLRVVWILSSMVGLPLLAGKTSMLVRALAVGFPPR